MISYAQNYEDVILARVFAGKTEGFYVDIGAADPVKHSVTKHFYDLGWNGVNVEPVRLRCEKLTAARPRDRVLKLAIGAVREQRTFYTITKDDSTAAPELSTLDPAQAFLNQPDHRVVETPIEVITLAELFATHAAHREVDFLKIDVEGQEDQVLRSGNWSRFRPRVLVINATTPTTPIPNHQEWEPFILKENYLFAYFDGLNRFYVRREDEALLAKLAVPPNVFDDFQTYHERHLEVSLNEQLAGLEPADAQLSERTIQRDEMMTNLNERTQEIELLRTELAIRVNEKEALAAELATSEQNCLALRQRLAALVEQLNWRTAELSATSAELDRTRTSFLHESNRLQGRLDERTEEVTHLRQVLAQLHASRFWRYTGWVRGMGGLLRRKSANPQSALAASNPATPTVIGESDHPAPTQLVGAAPVAPVPPPPAFTSARRLAKRCLKSMGGQWAARQVEHRVVTRTVPLEVSLRQTEERLTRLEAEIAKLQQRGLLMELNLDALSRVEHEEETLPPVTKASTRTNVAA